MLKPASQTPLSALLLAELETEAGLPPGWLNVVVGPASEIGDVLVEDERVRAITFTGSGEVGWGSRERAPRKQVKLELGNATPVIVAGRRRPRRRGRAARRERLLLRRPELHLGAADLRRSGRPTTSFLERFVPKVEALVVGDPADEETDVGPLIDDDARDRVLALDRGGAGGRRRVLAGGELEGDLIRPTVIANAGARPEGLLRGGVRARSARSTPYDSLDEAIELANGTRYGLQAGIFTADVEDRAARGAASSSSAASRSTRRRPSAPTRCPTAASRTRATPARARPTRCAS